MEIRTESEERPQLSIYLPDVLSYVVPGATFLILVFIFEMNAPARSDGQSHRLTALWHNTIVPGLQMGWLVPLLLGLALLLACYVAGHVVDSIATLFIDRILVYKGHGYPYEYLLQVAGADDTESANPNGWSGFSRNFYVAMFSWINFYFLCRLGELIAWYRHSASLYDLSLGFAFASEFVLLYIVATKCIVGIGKGRHHNRMKHWLTATASGKAMVSRTHVIIRFAAKPYTLLKPLFSDLLNTRRSFSSEFLEEYKRQFQGLFGLDPSRATSNNYWMAYCYVNEKSRPLASVARHWDRLQMFSRNLAVAFYLVFLFSLTWLDFHRYMIDWNDRTLATGLAISCASISMGCILLVRYYYLYSCYFSKYVFRAFVFLSRMEERSTLQQNRKAAAAGKAVI